VTGDRARATTAGVAVRRLPRSGPVPVRVLRFPADPGAIPGLHVHDHVALVYFEIDAPSLGSGSHAWDARAGDILLAVPGEVYDARGLEAARAWAVFFSPEVLGKQVPEAFFAWQAHPLLHPFASGGGSGTGRRIRVPEADRAWWTMRLAELDRELGDRRDGFGEAAMALLTLLLVALARLASDIPAVLRGNDEPLLADVFRLIDERYAERLSLRDIATAVALSPAHLTTVVRRATGLPVHAWIVERRMLEARRLLARTGLSVEEVGRRAGYEDAAYFIRAFRRFHGTTPLAWRRSTNGGRGADTLP
jgi:AraC family transcriptional regulator, transcriptional activator of pobA